MSLNVSKSLYRFKSYHLTEDEHLTYLRKILPNIYEDTQTISKIRKGYSEENSNFIKNSKNVVRNIKERYKNNSFCNIPWIDSSLWNQISSVSNEDLPSSIVCGEVRFTEGDEINQRSETKRKLFNSEVRSSDYSSIQRYISNSRKLPVSKIRDFGLAGINAALALKLVSRNRDNDYDYRRSVTHSVKSTAKNTNSGWPLFKKKNDPVCIADTSKWLSDFLKNPTYYSLHRNSMVENYTSLFHRVQPSVDENVCSAKIRQVWCVPQRIIALEHYFFSGILEDVMNNNKNGVNPIYSSGLTNQEISNSLVSRMRRRFGTARNKKIYSLDYSKYDSSIPNFAIDLFFAIVKDYLNLTEKEGKAFECLRSYTRNTPLSYGNNLYIKAKGVMSGTYITNVFDTWFNLVLWNLSQNTHANLDEIPEHVDFIEFIEFKESSLGSFRTDLALCGDDVIIHTTFVEILTHRRICVSLGMKIEEKFSYDNANDNIYFLGRYWDINSRPVNSFTYFISHICFRTRFYNEKDVGRNVLDKLDLNRILSICLPHYNGVNFLNKYFKNWKPYRDFVDNGTDYVLLKEWPNENYLRVGRLKAFNWKAY